MSEEEIELIEQFNYDFLSASRFKLDFPINMQVDDDTHNAIMKMLQMYKQLEKENERLKRVVEDRDKWIEALEEE